MLLKSAWTGVNHNFKALLKILSVIKPFISFYVGEGLYEIHLTGCVEIGYKKRQKVLEDIVILFIIFFEKLFREL